MVSGKKTSRIGFDETERDVSTTRCPQTSSSNPTHIVIQSKRLESIASNLVAITVGNPMEEGLPLDELLNMVSTADDPSRRRRAEGDVRRKDTIEALKQ